MCQNGLQFLPRAAVRDRPIWRLLEGRWSWQLARFYQAHLDVKGEGLQGVGLETRNPHPGGPSHMQDTHHLNLGRSPLFLATATLASTKKARRLCAWYWWFPGKLAGEQEQSKPRKPLTWWCSQRCLITVDSSSGSRSSVAPVGGSGQENWWFAPYGTYPGARAARLWNSAAPRLAKAAAGPHSRREGQNCYPNGGRFEPCPIFETPEAPVRHLRPS